MSMNSVRSAVAQTLDTFSSGSMDAAQVGVRRLYRSLLRRAPQILSLYEVDRPVEDANAVIRHNFDKFKHIRDAEIVDRLVFKGRTELEEAMNIWKQKSHIMRYFLEFDEEQQQQQHAHGHAVASSDSSAANEASSQPSAFLESFYQHERQ